MSEFKFACPVCGQHITADSKDTGSQISCPTCFRKIVVPQAPSSGDAKFVVSASEANKPRPPQTTPSPLEGMERQPAKTPFPIALIILVVLACGAGATVFALRGRIFRPKPDSGPTGANAETNQTGTETQPMVVRPDYAGSNLWTLDLAQAEFPEMPVAGSLHHEGFELGRATLSGSNLTLRVGRNGPVELGLNVYFFNRQAEELSGKTAEVKPTDTTAPRVVLHWKEAERKSQTFHNGYAMKVEFRPAANGSIPGKILICLPDESKSWIAGSFTAEIRKPGPPKPKPPAPPRPTQ
jgi:DNA-directed RNA polymerase subunit RPC12/RpoP